MSKKLLSLALAVVMLVSMFAFTVAAAGEVADGCKIGFYVTTDAYVGMPAEQYVTFSFYYSVPDDLDLDTYRHNYANIAVAYTDAFALDTTSTLNGADAREFGSSYVDFYKESSKVTLNSSAKIIAAIDERDTDKNWSTGIYVQQTAEGSSYTTSTGYPIDPDCEVFTLRFKTTRTVKDTDSIGVPAGAYGGTYFNMKYTESLKAKAYDPADVDFSNNVAYPEVKAAGPEVVALGTMARMDDWSKAETTNTFDGGLIGQINNANLTFEDGECNEIESIEVYANGQKMGNAYQVYKVNDTTYQFRAVVKGMDKTANTYSTDVEYEFRVTMKGDYAASGVLTATKTVSAETIFTTAYNAYKAANA